LTNPDWPPSHIDKILKSGRYSDLTIKCHGRVFKVHRNIIAVQSKPLAAAIDGDFKVRSISSMPAIFAIA